MRESCQVKTFGQWKTKKILKVAEHSFAGGQR